MRVIPLHWTHRSVAAKGDFLKGIEPNRRITAHPPNHVQVWVVGHQAQRQPAGLGVQEAAIPQVEQHPGGTGLQIGQR